MIDSEDLPDTLTQTGTVSLEQETIKNPWARLMSLIEKIDAVDLVQESIKFGRDENCDILICKSKFPSAHVPVISKIHFVLTKKLYGPAYITDLSKNGTFINGKLIGKNKKCIIQNNDIISAGHKGIKVYMFKLLESLDDRYLPEELRTKYEPGEFLGRGAAGEVRLVYEKSSCKKYAVKKITKGSSNTSKLDQLNHPSKIKSEIKILKSLKHPFIIGMKEIVETDKDVFIILDYMEGGELSNRITNPKGMAKNEIKFLFIQMVLAVQYLHSRGITHRDLKPDNVLLVSNNTETALKVADFGLSKEEDVMQTICGTPNYVAPEILNGRYKYTNQVDVWSLGVILFYMFSQELPFLSPDRGILFKMIRTGAYHMNNPKWQSVPHVAKDLIGKMLCVNPSRRVTIDGILNHPWIAEDIHTQYKVKNLLDECPSPLNNIVEIKISYEDFEIPAKRFREESAQNSSFSQPSPKRIRLGT